MTRSDKRTPMTSSQSQLVSWPAPSSKGMFLNDDGAVDNVNGLWRWKGGKTNRAWYRSHELWKAKLKDYHSARRREITLGMQPTRPSHHGTTSSASDMLSTSRGQTMTSSPMLFVEPGVACKRRTVHCDIPTMASAWAGAKVEQ